MKTSDEGIRLNKSFEGYHKKLANGDCTAYQTYLGKSKVTGKALYDIPTCGYGTTKDVKMGMVWTEAEATSRMMQDLEAAEQYVTQCVTVPINQNQFDALVLFTNNCGVGNLKKLIVPLNKGDAMGTAKKLPLYNKAQGKVLAGLVSRRAREQALFLKPVAAPYEPFMAQTVTKSREPLGEKAAATIGTGLTLATTQYGPKAMGLLDTAETVVNTGQRARGVGQNGRELGMWALTLASWPELIGVAVLGGGLFWLLCIYLPSK